MAIGVLKVTEHTSQIAVARMLGLTVKTEGALPTSPTAPANVDQRPQNTSRQSVPKTAVPPRPVEQPEYDYDPRDDAWLEQLPSASASLPEWFHEVEAFSEKDTTGRNVPTTIEPLFLERWTRALIQEAICTPCPNGVIDIESAIATLSNGKPLALWPKRERRRLHRGVQVLVDCNESMRPYSLDQTQLINRIRDIIGREIVHSIAFVGCPLRVLKTDGIGEAAYEPPSRGTPVLILTDFGASAAGIRGRFASIADWQKFLVIVREAGCPIVAFTPYPAKRISILIHQSIAVVKWDRSTTSAIIRHLRDKSEITL
ncbi:MAG: hypothetical protein WCH39_12850 [Schlesneria sp.]